MVGPLRHQRQVDVSVSGQSDTVKNLLGIFFFLSLGAPPGWSDDGLVDRRPCSFNVRYPLYRVEMRVLIGMLCVLHVLGSDMLFFFSGMVLIHPCILVRAS